MYILGLGFFKNTNWYVFEAVVLYFLFYICFKVFRPWKALVILTGVVMFFLFFAFYFRIENPWYGSTMCFPLGIFYSLYQEKVELFFRKNLSVKAVVLLVMVFVSIIIFYWLGENSLLGNLIARNCASTSFAIFIMILLQKFRLGNMISLFLGEISYEIFLIHPWVIRILQYYDVSDAVVFTYLCIGCTILLAYIVHIPLKIFNRILVRKWKANTLYGSEEN